MGGWVGDCPLSNSLHTQLKTHVSPPTHPPTHPPTYLTDLCFGVRAAVHDRTQQIRVEGNELLVGKVEDKSVHPPQGGQTDGTLGRGGWVGGWVGGW